MARSLYLADTNILLRLVQQRHPEYAVVRDAVGRLRNRGIDLGYTLQNMAEFWNASTRPLSRNGFNLTLDETERNAREIERSFTFLPDTESVYTEWRRLVMQYRISGVQVHDARLAAAMYARGMTHVLTLNSSDFARFDGLTAIEPIQV
ncbi:Predicted nucleic acid-binding protein, contains PIN domain [Granulicella rosea]|uniref:Predicted nucleic acid-binding protein, contains PIN domain n=1 Tax=Granulicella rosea TaxID=474952 RepID=A0A239CYD4_9BACT|nr:PIN domain-containing protein [Granulicella rosea]SNS24363.1 Predicted nucleic acid-binding protein, contains PIN domain [Granulicella rosea]